MDYLKKSLSNKEYNEEDYNKMLLRSFYYYERLPDNYKEEYNEIFNIKPEDLLNYNLKGGSNLKKKIKKSQYQFLINLQYHYLLNYYYPNNFITIQQIENAFDVNYKNDKKITIEERLKDTLLKKQSLINIEKQNTDLINNIKQLLQNLINDDTLKKFNQFYYNKLLVFLNNVENIFLSITEDNTTDIYTKTKQAQELYDKLVNIKSSLEQIKKEIETNKNYITQYNSNNLGVSISKQIDFINNKLNDIKTNDIKLIHNKNNKNLKLNFKLKDYYTKITNNKELREKYEKITKGLNDEEIDKLIEKYKLNLEIKRKIVESFSGGGRKFKGGENIEKLNVLYDLMKENDKFKVNDSVENSIIYNNILKNDNLDEKFNIKKEDMEKDNINEIIKENVNKMKTAIIISKAYIKFKAKRKAKKNAEREAKEHDEREARTKAERKRQEEAERKRQEEKEAERKRQEEKEAERKRQEEKAAKMRQEEEAEKLEAKNKSEKEEKKQAEEEAERQRKQQADAKSEEKADAKSEEKSDSKSEEKAEEKTDDKPEEKIEEEQDKDKIDKINCENITKFKQNQNDCWLDTFFVIMTADELNNLFKMFLNKVLEEDKDLFNSIINYIKNTNKENKAQLKTDFVEKFVKYYNTKFPDNKINNKSIIDENGNGRIQFVIELINTLFDDVELSNNINFDKKYFIYLIQNDNDKITEITDNNYTLKAIYYPDDKMHNGKIVGHYVGYYKCNNKWLFYDNQNLSIKNVNIDDLTQKSETYLFFVRNEEEETKDERQEEEKKDNEEKNKCIINIINKKLEDINYNENSIIVNNANDYYTISGEGYNNTYKIGKSNEIYKFLELEDIEKQKETEKYIKLQNPKNNIIGLINIYARENVKFHLIISMEYYETIKTSISNVKEIIEINNLENIYFNLISTQEFPESLLNKNIPQNFNLIEYYYFFFDYLKDLCNIKNINIILDDKEYKYFLIFNDLFGDYFNNNNNIIFKYNNENLDYNNFFNDNKVKNNPNIINIKNADSEKQFMINIRNVNNNLEEGYKINMLVNNIPELQTTKNIIKNIKNNNYDNNLKIYFLLDKNNINQINVVENKEETKEENKEVNNKDEENNEDKENNEDARKRQEEEKKEGEEKEEIKDDTKTEETKTEDCIEIIINDSFIKEPFEENTIIIDPAGLAFKENEKKYKGGGASGTLYTFLGLNKDGITHNLSPINTGEAKFNNELDYTKYNNINGVIHAVGPDNNNNNLNYFDNLKKTIQSINDEISKLSNNNYNIRLPLISASIYKPDNINLKDYFKKYIPYVKEILCKNNKINKIYLALYSNEEIDAYNKVEEEVNKGEEVKEEVNEKKGEEKVKEDKENEIESEENNEDEYSDEDTEVEYSDEDTDEDEDDKIYSLIGKLQTLNILNDAEGIEYITNINDETFNELINYIYIKFKIDKDKKINTNELNIDDFKNRNINKYLKSINNKKYLNNKEDITNLFKYISNKEYDNQTGGKIDKIIENMVNEYNNKKVKKYKIVKKLN